ncbi:serine/threonine-protein kinase pim-3-like [Paramormyrops kingsleyae]|uniref:serine/threonine-protein kinase pim-3-like n=1 Tax=Paramormyrops kingsleyae TaxID=1676925 RepID=UPI003B970AB0
MLDDYIMILKRPDPCQDLFQFCRSKGGFLAEDLARHVLAQVLQVLCHCQKHNVLHRDLKPEILLIQMEILQVKLIDFSCGDIWRDSVYTELANSHYTVGAGFVFWGPNLTHFSKNTQLYEKLHLVLSGTEDYTPPEWFLTQKYRAGPCTVWSLGVTLYQLVCGYLPFPSKRAAIRGRLKFPLSVSPGEQLTFCPVTRVPQKGVLHYDYVTLPMYSLTNCRNLIRQCLKRKAADCQTMEQIELHPWFRHC